MMPFTFTSYISDWQLFRTSITCLSHEVRTTVAGGATRLCESATGTSYKISSPGGRTTRTAATLLTAVLLLTVASPIFAQPTPPPSPESRPADDTHSPNQPRRRFGFQNLLAPKPGETDDQFRARIRELLQRQLDSMRRRQERVQKITEMLDKGASPADIREQFQEMGPLGAIGTFNPADDLNDEPRPDNASPNNSPGQGFGPGSWRREGGFHGSKLDELASLNPLRPEEPDGPPAPRDNDKPQSLMPEDEAFITDFLKASAPDMLSRLEKLKEREPDRIKQRYEQMFPRLRWLKDLRDRDPSLFTLRLDDIRFAREAVESARKIARYDQPTAPDAKAPKDAKANDPADRAKQMAMLQTSLKSQYKVRSELFKRELDKWQARLSAAQAEFTKRDEQQDKVVSEFADKLIAHERERLTHPRPHDKDRDHAPDQDGPPPQRP